MQLHKVSTTAEHFSSTIGFWSSLKGYPTWSTNLWLILGRIFWLTSFSCACVGRWDLERVIVDAIFVPSTVCGHHRRRFVLGQGWHPLRLRNRLPAAVLSECNRRQPQEQGFRGLRVWCLPPSSESKFQNSLSTSKTSTARAGEHHALNTSWKMLSFLGVPNVHAVNLCFLWQYFQRYFFRSIFSLDFSSF